MNREQVLENFYMVKEASAEMSRVERHARNVDKAATKSLPSLHAHTVKLEEHYDVPIPMKKKAALENFYMVKEAFEPIIPEQLRVGAEHVKNKYEARRARKRAATKKAATSRRRGRGLLPYLAGGLATGYLANEAYKKYKKSRN